MREATAQGRNPAGKTLHVHQYWDSVCEQISACSLINMTRLVPFESLETEQLVFPKEKNPASLRTKEPQVTRSIDTKKISTKTIDDNCFIVTLSAKYMAIIIF